MPDDPATGQEPSTTPSSGQEPRRENEPTSQTATTTTTSSTTPSGQEPKAETFDAEYVKTLRAEAAANRKKAADLEAKLKEHEDAKLSEAERLKKQADEATQRADQLAAELRQERTRLAVGRAAAEAGIAAEIAERLIDVEYAEDGAIKTDLKAAMTALLVKHPHLAQPSTANGASAANPARSGQPAAARQRRSASPFDVEAARAETGGVFWNPDLNPRQRESQAG